MKKYLLMILMFFVPHLAFAAVISPGCHATTPDELKALQDRGIPAAYQTCPSDTKDLGVGQNFDQWYAQLKQVSPCNRNSCALSCRTRNTGAQVCGPTAKRWNSIGCHPNNNTAIFPSVAYGFAAHIELLRRFCGERGRCTIASVIQQWSTGNHPEYINFVSRYAGIPYNQVFNPNDIDMMGRIALTMSCFESGSLPYSADELKQGLSMAAGGARVAVPSNVGQLLNDSLQGSYVSNPSYSPSSAPSSWTYPASSVSGSTYVPPTVPTQYSSSPVTSSSGSSYPYINYSNTSSSTSTYVPNYPSNIQFPFSSTSSTTTPPGQGSSTPSIFQALWNAIHIPYSTSSSQAGTDVTGVSIDTSSQQSLSDQRTVPSPGGTTETSPNMSGQTTFSDGNTAASSNGSDTSSGGDISSIPSVTFTALRNILTSIASILHNIISSLAAQLYGQ